MKTTQIATEATAEEIQALLKRSGKGSRKEALNDAMQYYISHSEE